MNVFTPFPLPTPPTFSGNRVSIRDHGAVEGGDTLNTQAIAQAIESCHSAGGGQVVIPAGIWLTGPIHLRSHINLHLEKGAELRFSQNPDDYLPVVYQQRGGIRCHNYSPFIYAHRCHNIAITGEGILDGQGSTWWPWKHKQPGMVHLFEANVSQLPVEQRVYGTPGHGVRPPFLQPLECRDILIEGVTFRNSPSWTVHPVWCENITIRNISILNPVDAHNTDGIDPDGCRNVLIEHCHVDTGDDGICLKSGRGPDAWEVGTPCENILIRHCTIKSAHGGIVIGSEMAAGVSNVLAHDCQCDGTDVGIRLKTRPGRRGYIRNVEATRISMRNIRLDAILITMRYAGEKLDIDPGGLVDVPQVHDILVRDCDCESAAQAIRLEGLPGHPLRNITLENIRITANQGILTEEVEGLHCSNLHIVTHPTI